MAEFTPHTDIYKIKNRLDCVSKFIFWLTILLSIFPVLFAEICTAYQLVDIINVINMIGIGLYFTIEILNEFILLPLADNKRRDDFIDNSFGSKFSPKNSVSYYDNDKISFGLYKAAVNQFENCFFTFSLVKITTVSKVILPTIMLISMGIISYYGFKEVPFALTILQALFSANILGSLIKHLILINRLSSIHDSWLQLFQTDDLKLDTLKFQANIYRYWLQYETLHSKINAGIAQKTFNKSNVILTQDWENLKVKYNIN